MKLYLYHIKIRSACPSKIFVEFLMDAYVVCKLIIASVFTLYQVKKIKIKKVHAEEVRVEDDQSSRHTHKVEK